jgi:hypothetical protein
MRLPAVIAFLALTSAALAQQMVSMQTVGDNAIVTLRVNETSFVTISGAPYSAKRVTNGVQVRADGTRIPQNQTALFYRDGAGRNRTEKQVALRDSPYMVTIMDPTLGCEYVLDPGNRIAHRLVGPKIRTQPLEAVQAMRRQVENEVGPLALAGTASSQDGITTRREDLGSRTIQGLTANGSRVTTTYPPGTRQNNDHAIVTIDESWLAPSLGNVVVLSRTVSPDTTETNYSLADVVVGEPDPKLFAPPADYRIVDEKSDFKISVPRNPASAVTKLSPHGPTPATVPNAPFAGTRTNSGNQVLADGTRVARAERTVFSTWRDSQGRVRTEWPPQGIVPGGVEIKDPTTGFVYLLDYVGHVAYRSPLSLNAASAAAGTPGSAGETITSVPIGVQTISGVAATGVRTTAVRPSNNGKPMTTTSEIWTASAEGVVLLEKTSTSEGDETTIALKNFSTREPDASLFKVPATYQILDEFGNQIAPGQQK